MFLLLTITNVPLLVRDNSIAIANILSTLAAREQSAQSNGEEKGLISSSRIPTPDENRIIKLYAARPANDHSFDFILQERTPTTTEEAEMLNKLILDKAYRQSKIDNGALFSTAWISVEPDTITVRHSNSDGIFEAKVERQTGEIILFEKERIGVRSSVSVDQSKADEYILRPLEILSGYLRTLSI